MESASGVELLREQRIEDEDRSVDPRVAKLLALVDRRDAEAPGLERQQRVRDTHGAEPVGIGLHHRQQRNSRGAREAFSVTHQRAEVDFDPGARHQPLH